MKKCKRYLRSNIISDLNVAVSTGTLSVHNSLRDALTGEVGELIEEMEVLGEDGTAGASRHRVLVVIDGCTRASGDNLSFDHGRFKLFKFYIDKTAKDFKP